MAHELVGGSAECGVSCSRSILRLVYLCLEVLDAGTHGKGLALERYLLLMEELEDIAGRMAAGKHDLMRCDILAALDAFMLLRHMDA